MGGQVSRTDHETELCTQESRLRTTLLLSLIRAVNRMGLTMNHTICRYLEPRDTGTTTTSMLWQY